MRITVEYNVDARNLDDAIADAKARLARFAPNVSESGWEITMRCAPLMAVMNGDAEVWRVTVEAERT